MFVYWGNCTFLLLTVASISILPFIYKTEQCPHLCIENMQITPIVYLWTMNNFPTND